MPIYVKAHRRGNVMIGAHSRRSKVGQAVLHFTRGDRQHRPSVIAALKNANRSIGRGILSSGGLARYAQKKADRELIKKVLMEKKNKGYRMSVYKRAKGPIGLVRNNR